MSCLPGTVYVVSKFEDGRWRECSTKHETRQAWRPGTIRTEGAETAVEFIRSACGRSRYPRYGRGSGVLLSGQGRQSGLTVPTPHVRSGGRFTRTAAGNYLLGWGMLSGAWSLRGSSRRRRVARSAFHRTRRSGGRCAVQSSGRRSGFRFQCRERRAKDSPASGRHSVRQHAA